MTAVSSALAARYKQRMVATTHTSACPLDCPDLCSLRVEVEDGKVVKVDGVERGRAEVDLAVGGAGHDVDEQARRGEERRGDLARGELRPQVAVAIVGEDGCDHLVLAARVAGSIEAEAGEQRAEQLVVAPGEARRRRDGR